MSTIETARALCKFCGEQIEPTGGKLYLWTHVDGEQQKCTIAQPANGVLPKAPKEKYDREDFSSEAVHWRFDCGSWNERDVLHCIHALRTVPELLKTIEELNTIAGLANTLLEQARVAIRRVKGD